MKKLFGLVVVGITTAILMAQVEQAYSQALRSTFHESTSVQGSGRVKAGNLTFLVNINVLGNSAGSGSGTVQYKGEQDGLQVGIQAQCVKTFLLGEKRTPIVAIAGPIVSGSSQVTGKGKWIFVGIKDSAPDGIRFVDTSMEKALQLCNQPTDSFPATFTSGGISISH
ncbi:MAG TPA: hypothetical protein V6C64_11720 [Microcoleaceae cyanobacterium]|jgi:hypothetical protein